ncbi:hypothetical protein [Vibrio parahaemolyticus]|uniref:hypothetical protein n=1 Tax=Vibrio parahaemolyticus TaxID=670 RepID=UPI0004DFC7DB|nr:hypothetical protein [Vibrio parahaemolyticus]MBD6984204.1 hypothetical protein [Vibrio parahaemolyticus]MBD6989090.1 hypothetical protein [Vibrio parahaemolyticus]
MSVKQKLHHLFVELFIAPKKQKSRSYYDLDPKIAPLVHVLNSFDGVTTIASCQGHAAGWLEPPYVYFNAPLPLVQQIVTTIRQAHLDDKFHHAWKITGEFNEQNQLTFTLSSPYYDENYLEKRIISLAWHRQKVDEDIHTLSHCLGKM